MMELRRRGFMVGTGAALVAASARRANPAPAFKTVTPGVLTIANSGEMPMIAMEGDKLIGSDAEIIATIAGKLGLGVVSAQMAPNRLATGLPERKLRDLCRLQYAHHYWSPETMPSLA